MAEVGSVVAASASVDAEHGLALADGRLKPDAPGYESSALMQRCTVAIKN